MRDLAKNSVVISGTEFLLVFVSIIRNKFLAVTIGPEGFGIYSLLNSFFAMIAVFAGASLGTGATKFVAEYSNDGQLEKRNQVFTFAIGSVVIIGILLSVLFVFARGVIINDFLSKEVAETYYLLFVAGFIATSLNPILMNVLQGVLEVKMVVKARIIISVVDVLLILGLVSVFNLLGFFIAVLVSATFASSVLLYFVYRGCGFRFTRVNLKDKVSRDMGYFGGVSVITGVLNLGSLYLQRLLLVEKMGIAAVGIFQAGYSIMSYLGLVSRGSVFHFLPTMSKDMDDKSRVKRLNEYILFVLFVTIPVSVMAILFGDIAVRVLYSKRFLPLTAYLFWFVAAQFIIMLEVSFQTVVVGMAKLRIHVVAVFLMHSLWIVVPFFLIRYYGIPSLAMGFLAGAIVASLVYVVYLRKTIGLRFERKTTLLSIFGTAAILVSGFFMNADLMVKIILASLAVTGLLLFLNASQRKSLFEFTRKAISYQR